MLQFISFVSHFAFTDKFEVERELAQLRARELKYHMSSNSRVFT